MRDRVPPVHQLGQEVASSDISGVYSVDGAPEIDAESLEVLANGAGVGITLVNPAVPHELGADKSAELLGKRCRNMVSAFRV